MDIDETQLTQFFGVPPLAEPPEEKEFFGSSTYEMVRDGMKLVVSFSSHHEDMLLRVLPETGGDPIIEVAITAISEVRIDSARRRLSVVGIARGEAGADPQVEERVTITLDPLRVTVRD
jgi:hypothetical protein